jgi:glycine/D-amino acid oxidase-like deaminating enzyme
MYSDVLIIGQGLCGTFLHWYLTAAGFKCTIVDDNSDRGASLIAAGIINPVTGRRLVQTWMINELMPFANTAYKTLEKELNADFISTKEIIEFCPAVQMRQAFLERVQEKAEYLSLPDDETKFLECFHYELGYGMISPSYLVQPAALLKSYRKKIKHSGELVEEHIDSKYFRKIDQRWHIGDLQSKFVVFCDGISSYSSDIFHKLPFAPNKGEVLYIEVNDLPDTYLFKKGVNLVPVEENIYWVGSSYEWSFDNDQPSPEFLNKTNQLLKNWLKLPFKIIDHRTAIRPATLERRPFVGMHPDDPTIGILNGMGTKGCTLAPYFANQLCRHLSQGKEILPEASIHRFRNLLTRGLNPKNC